MKETKTSNDLPDVSATTSFKLRSPSGELVVFFYEDTAGKPIGIEIFLGKPGSEARTWAQAFSRVLTHNLLNGQMTLAEIYQEISSLTTDKSVMDNGVRIRSGPEAVAVAILRYNTYRVSKMHFSPGATEK